MAMGLMEMLVALLQFSRDWLAPILLVSIFGNEVFRKDIIGKTESALKQRWIRKAFVWVGGIVGILAILANFGVTPLG